MLDGGKSYAVYFIIESRSRKYFYRTTKIRSFHTAWSAYSLRTDKSVSQLRTNESDRL